MRPLTEYTSYADAQRHCSGEALWALFDGDREQLNIAQECLDRHLGKDLTIRIAYGDGRDEVHGYECVAAWSNRFANYLAARNLPVGARIALMLEPSLPFYFALFGAMKAGHVAVPLFTLFGPDGVALRIDDCKPALFLTTADLADRIPAGVDLDLIIADDDFLAELMAYDDGYTARTRSDDMAMYQYTSGTTRELPEAVKHRHRSVVTVMLAALYATGVRPGDRFFCPASPAWGLGLWHGTLAPMALGVSITAWSGRFDPERMLQVLQDYEITNLAAAATHYRMLRNSGKAKDYRYKIEKLSFTGEPIDSASAEFAAETFGTPVRSIYGTTEVGVILANYPGADDIEVRPGSLGKPMPGIDVAIRDRSGTTCPPDTVGEIMVRRRDTWIATKDLGHSDADGYFYHDGRADDVIISAGWTMSAVEIEDVLLRHPDVEEAAAIGVADALRGQVVKAFIVSRRRGNAAFIEELQNFVRTRLSQHEYPRQVAFPASLPKTPAGKVNRSLLRRQEQAAALERTEETHD